MNKAKIVHLGIGNVGKALVRQILEADCGLIYCGMFNSKGGIFRESGLLHSEIKKFPNGVEDLTFEKIIRQLADKNYIVVDTTASDKTYELLIKALQKGCSVVVSNKKPLCKSFGMFERIAQKNGERFFYETTVGAGLPVIKTLKNLILTGDKIIRIEGCFSGTLGYIFSELEKGVSFSVAVKKAFELGFTEPDPRDDLSGIDVARKALILNRMMGKKMELSDIKLIGLYPDNMKKLTAENFLISIEQLDQSYSEKIKKAKNKRKALRFVANIINDESIVGLTEVDKESDIGNLKGPDNFVLFQSKRYDKNPLIIKGPGAGVEVTAAGVFADILEARRSII